MKLPETVGILKAFDEDIYFFLYFIRPVRDA